MLLCLDTPFPDAPILVTGASSGIGSTIALRLNASGCKVIASGRDISRLEDMKDRAVKPDAFFLETRELGEVDGLDKWVNKLAARYGKLGGLAYAAGITETRSFLQYDYANALQMFDLLCHAPIMVAKGAVSRKNCVPDGFSIVFVASAAAIAPNKGQLVYGAAKAALVTAARCMAKELAPRKIRVNCISPGLVKTHMFDTMIAVLGDDFATREEKLYPLGLGEPQDVANLTVFLLSNASRWVTAQNIVIDGGRLA